MARVPRRRHVYAGLLHQLAQSRAQRGKENRGAHVGDTASDNASTTRRHAVVGDIEDTRNGTGDNDGSRAPLSRALCVTNPYGAGRWFAACSRSCPRFSRACALTGDRSVAVIRSPRQGGIERCASDSRDQSVCHRGKAVRPGAVSRESGTERLMVRARRDSESRHHVARGRPA